MRAHLIGFNDTSSEEFWKKLVVGAQKCSLISFQVNKMLDENEIYSQYTAQNTVNRS